jgi:hypothetical protein
MKTTIILDIYHKETMGFLFEKIESSINDLPGVVSVMARAPGMVVMNPVTQPTITDEKAELLKQVRDLMNVSNQILSRVQLKG